MLQETHFIGVLANVDDSILKICLNHGFKIKAMHRDDGIQLISQLESISSNGIYDKLWLSNCINKDNIYYIDYSFKSNIEKDKNGMDALNKTESTNGNVHTYLIPTIRLMKLFKEGNISMPFRYLYFIDNRHLKPLSMTMNTLYIKPELYSVESSEISDLQKFIHDVRIPFKEDYIQIAFENFELSYQITNRGLSFITLMTSLEVLVDPDSGKRSEKISTNIAFLLGKKREDKKNISSDIRKMYDNTRTNIIHSGKFNTDADLPKLRYYVRESIKEVNRLNINKDDLIELLDSKKKNEKNLS